MTYTVGEMAKFLGIAPSALRYYDKEGLLPFVERSAGGMRVFHEQDYEWLKVIECLKHTGMSIRDIKRFIDLTMQGDATIDERLELFLRQRESIRQQMQDLQQTLDILEFKCWYYEMAKAAGTTTALRNMPLSEIPKPYRAAGKKLKELPRSESIKK